MVGPNESQQLRDLQQVTDAALSYLPLEELLDSLLVRVREIIGVDTAAMLLLEEDDRTLVPRAAKGLEEEVEAGIRIPLGRGFAGRIAAQKVPVRIDDVDHAEILNPILREKGLRSLLGVPLLVEGRVIGVMHVGTLTDRRFSDEDSDLLQAAADRAALAVHARLAERQRGLAEEIQRSLFPTRLPEFPGLCLAARYRPAAAAALGGDWYDAFMLPGGSLGLAMGDVVGRGFRAAALMSQLRSALRAYAFEESSPAAPLRKLNSLLRQIDPHGSATLLYLVFDPDTATVTLSGAGHPPPLLANHDGGSEYLTLGPSPPLGMTANPVYPELTVGVEPPVRLVLYTDGLVERAGEPLEAGLERLRQALPEETLSPSQATDHVLHEMLPEGAPSDDVAVVAVEITPLADPLEITLPAEAESAPLLRRLLRRWLRGHGASEQEIDSLTLATAEAAANAIEHAYPPDQNQFRVDVAMEDGTVSLSVRDWGQWRPPRGQHRGRGLLLMEGLMDSVEVKPGDDGTRVTLKLKLSQEQRAGRARCS